MLAKVETFKCGFLCFRLLFGLGFEGFLRVATFSWAAGNGVLKLGESSIKRKAERSKVGEPGGKTIMHRSLNIKTAEAAETHIENRSRLPAITLGKLTEAPQGKIGE